MTRQKSYEHDRDPASEEIRDNRYSVTVEFGSLIDRARVAATNAAMESFVLTNAAGLALLQQRDQDVTAPRHAQVIVRRTRVE